MSDWVSGKNDWYGYWSPTHLSWRPRRKDLKLCYRENIAHTILPPAKSSAVIAEINSSVRLPWLREPIRKCLEWPGNGGFATTSARSGIRKGCLPDEKLSVLWWRNWRTFSSFKKSTYGKLTRQRIFSFSVPFTSVPWVTQRLRCTDTTPTKIRELREGRSKAPFPKMKGAANHEHWTSSA